MESAETWEIDNIVILVAVVKVKHVSNENGHNKIKIDNLPLKNKTSQGRNCANSFQLYIIFNNFCI